MSISQFRISAGLLGLAFVVACDATSSVGPSPAPDTNDLFVARPATSQARFMPHGRLDIPSMDRYEGKRIDSVPVPAFSASLPGFGESRGSGVTAPRMSVSVTSTESPSIVWSNVGSGASTIWKMSGASWTGQKSSPITLAPPWRGAGAADLNRDGHPDLIFENTSSGARIVVFMDGAGFNGHYSVIGVTPVAWRIAGTADFNSDGNPDLVFANDATGDMSVTYLSGATPTGTAALLNVGTAWKLETVGDLNANGKPDLILARRSDGLRLAAFMNGASFAGYAVMFSLNPQWELRATGDFNGDGSPDVLGQDANSGLRFILFLSGSSWNGQYTVLPAVAASERIVGTAAVQWGPDKTTFLKLVTFGDSNTDLGIQGVDPVAKATAYVSNAPDPASPVRLGPNDPNSPLMIAGKVESRWHTARSEVIRVVNHGVVATTTGTGRTFRSSPNALEVVNGFTRFEGEVLGRGYPWSGGETQGTAFPNGPVARVQAFTPAASDFVYFSLGTNDVISLSVPQILANITQMVDMWTSAGLPASHFIITTLPPREPENSASMPALNSGIRSLASARGLRLIDLAAHTSSDDGKTWIRDNMHVTGNPLHFAEEVRDWIADRVMEIIVLP